MYCHRKGQILFLLKNKPILILPKAEIDIIKMLEILIDIIFVMSGGSVFNRQSAFLWVITLLRLVPLFLRDRLHSGASEENRKESSPLLEFHIPLYK